MESIADLLAKNPLNASRLLRQSSDRPSPLEIAQRQAARQNAEPGALNLADGINCEKCKNRGYWIEVTQGSNGCVYNSMVMCSCNGLRQSFQRMKQSGLENSIREQTFKRFEAKEPWQKTMLEKAQRYVAEGVKDGRWFYIGGQPGCGKTHICTAISRELLREKPVRYVIWEQVAKQLKAIVNEADEYAEEVGKLERAEVLYIDDFFKPVKDNTGNLQQPTPADLRLAFEILNFRYINRKPTIISSEWRLSDLFEVDEATASRIYERSGEYGISVDRDSKKNHRMQTETML